MTAGVHDLGPSVYVLIGLDPGYSCSLCSMLTCIGLWRGWPSNLAKQLKSWATLNDQSSIIALGLGCTSARISKMLCRDGKEIQTFVSLFRREVGGGGGGGYFVI